MKKLEKSSRNDESRGKVWRVKKINYVNSGKKFRPKIDGRDLRRLNEAFELFEVKLLRKIKLK